MKPSRGVDRRTSVLLGLSAAVAVIAACDSPTDPPADPRVCPGSSYSPSPLPVEAVEDPSGDVVPTQTPPLLPVSGCTPFVLRLELPGFDPEAAGFTALGVGAVVDGAYHRAYSRPVDGPTVLPFALEWTVGPLTPEPMIGPDTLTIRARVAQFAPPNVSLDPVARDSIEFRVPMIRAGEPLPLTPDTVTLVLRQPPPSQGD